MDSLILEINQTSRLRLVDRAYLNAEGDRVVVELNVSPRSGLLRENTLFFPAQGFTVEQVKAAILRLRGALTRRS